MTDSNKPRATQTESIELREELTGIMYGAQWKKDERIAEAFKPDVEAALATIYKTLEAALPGWDDRLHAIKGVDEGIQIGWNAAIDQMRETLARLCGQGGKNE